MSLAAALLSLMMQKAHPGLSPHSFELKPECGTDERAPTCDVEAPTCAEPTILCRKPVYIDGAWRQVERKETARARFAVIADALADEAKDFAGEYGGKVWINGYVDLAAAMLAASYWSTGFREDIESGRKRGPAGEVCLADIQPMIAWSFARWPHANQSVREVSEQMVGSDYFALRRCFGAGLKTLSVMRRWSDAHCTPFVSRSYAGFSAYATGNACTTAGNKKYGDYAMKREELYRFFISRL
jgi:hypothetical protein